MIKNIISLIVLVLVLNFNNILFSQNTNQNKEPFLYIGPYAGLNFNFYNADFSKLPGFPNCCPQFTTGSGISFNFGGAINIPLDNQFSLEARLGLSGLNGTLSKEQIIGNTEIRNTTQPFETSNIVDAISEYTIDANLLLLGLEPYIKYQVIPNLNLNGGLRLGYLMTKTFDQKEVLKSPNDVVFKETQSRSRNEYTDVVIPEAKGMQLHLLLGASYDLELTKSIKLVPDLRYYLPLTKVASVDWSVSQLSLSAALMFGLYQPTEKNVIKRQYYHRDTTVIEDYNIVGEKVSLLDTRTEKSKIDIDEENVEEREDIYEKYERRVQKLSTLAASMIVTGINHDGTETKNPTIVIEETETYETFPLLPYVFFNENDATLSNTVQKLRTKEEANFTENDLPQSTYQVYFNLLNVIGSRMNQFPNTKITVVGNNNNTGLEKNNKALSKERAETVKRYLVDVWGINSNRISIETRNLPQNAANNTITEGLVENRRAEIYSTSKEIMKPITIMEYTKSVTPPKIKFTTAIQSDVGIKSSKMTVSQSGDVLKTFTNEHETMIWDIEKGKFPQLEALIDANFEVTDNKNNTVKVDESIKLQQLTIKKKREELIDDKRVEKFALILFDYDKSTLKPEHQSILNDIKNRIEPNSKVTISGYADATGEQNYNKELATRRTAAIVKVLNVAPDNLEVNNIGSDELLFENNSPFGRSFCRTVTIKIETPIK